MLNQYGSQIALAVQYLVLLSAIAFGLTLLSSRDTAILVLTMKVYLIIPKPISVLANSSELTWLALISLIRFAYLGMSLLNILISIVKFILVAIYTL